MSKTSGNKFKLTLADRLLEQLEMCTSTKMPDGSVRITLPARAWQLIHDYIVSRMPGRVDPKYTIFRRAVLKPGDNDSVVGSVVYAYADTSQEVIEQLCTSLGLARVDITARVKDNRPSADSRISALLVFSSDDDDDLNSFQVEVGKVLVWPSGVVEGPPVIMSKGKFEMRMWHSDINWGLDSNWSWAIDSAFEPTTEYCMSGDLAEAESGVPAEPVPEDSTGGEQRVVLWAVRHRGLVDENGEPAISMDNMWHNRESAWEVFEAANNKHLLGELLRLDARVTVEDRYDGDDG